MSQGLDDASGASGHVELAAGRFHYRTWRAGPDAPSAVLVHGNGSSSQTWSRVAPALNAAGVEVFALDLRGSPLSVKPPVGRYGLRDVADDLYDFIDALRLAAPFVIGHCWGGATAVVLATGAFSDRVPPVLSGLVLEELPPDMSATRDQPVVQDFLRMMRSPREYVARRVELTCRNWHPVDRERLVADACGADEDVYLSAIDDGAAAGPIAPLLARLRTPALVLRGDPDRGGMLDSANWRLVQQCLPGNATAVELADSGHELHCGDYPTFMRLVEEFLRRHSSLAAPAGPSSGGRL